LCGLKPENILLSFNVDSVNLLCDNWGLQHITVDSVDQLIGTLSTGNVFKRTFFYRTVSTYASPVVRLITKCVQWTWIGSRISQLVVCLTHWRDVRKLKYTHSRPTALLYKFSSLNNQKS